MSGTPTLSVHTPGNFGQAEHGGLSMKVSISPANAKRDVLRNMARLKKEMQLDYEVSYECTHHGPSLNVPTMFAELGSSPEQWKDLRAAEAVAHAVMEAVLSFDQSQAKLVIGIGGPHYNSKFTRLALESQVAFGHIIPKHVVPNVNTEILKQCVEKTSGQVRCAILDWKGIKGECKTPLIRMLDDIGLPFEKT